MNRTFGVLVLLMMTMAHQPSPPDANDLGVIKGTVVDPDGKPVEGARVYAAGDNDPPVNSLPDTTTSNVNGDFVLDHVRPGKVKIHAYKDSDYYMDVYFAFDLPPKLAMPEVEVQPRQTVTGVTVRLMQKAGKLHLNVRDADTKELIVGIGYQFCREDHPTEFGYCLSGGGLSDREHFMPVGVGISIQIKADDGRHVKWEYRDSKTGSLYFRAKSGETETMDVILEKKQEEITIDATKQQSGPARGRGPFPGSPIPGHSTGLPVSLDLEVPSGKLRSDGTIGVDFIITNIGAEWIKVPSRFTGPVDFNAFYDGTKILTLWFTSDAIRSYFFKGTYNKIYIVQLSAELYGRDDDPTSFYALAPNKSIRVHTSSPALDPGTYPLTAHAELIRLVLNSAGGSSELVGTADADAVTKTLPTTSRAKNKHRKADH